MLSHKPALLCHLHAFPIRFPSNLLRHRHHKPHFNQLCSLKKSFKICKYFSTHNSQVWPDYDEDNNILGDCIVFEDGIFEGPQNKNDQRNHIFKRENEEEEEEEESLIPEEWRDLQRELNVTKKERKKKIQRIELGNSFKRQREIELFRDGLSDFNTIKLPQLKFTESVKNSDNQQMENLAADARVLTNVSATDKLTGISSVREEDEEENVESLKGFSINARVINSFHVTDISSSVIDEIKGNLEFSSVTDGLAEIHSVREGNGEIGYGEEENMKTLESFSARGGVLSSRQVTEFSSSGREESEEISSGEDGNLKMLESFSVNERVLSPRHVTEVSSSFVRDSNGEFICGEEKNVKPLERFSVRGRVLVPRQVTEVSYSVRDGNEGNSEIYSVRDENKGNGDVEVGILSESSVNGRVLPRNPRLQVVGAGFEDISKMFDEEYKVEDDGNTNEEDRSHEPRQLYTLEEKVLLNKRMPDLQQATSEKWIPLHTFATAGQSYLLGFLLTHNVDINAIDKDGRSAVHKAITCKKEGMVSYLLRAGADALVRDKDGATLIHYAVEVAAIQTIKHLILYKVDINVPDNYGWTPLHLAVQSKRTDVVRLLLVRGADKNIRNKDGNTPLDLCLVSGQDIRTYELIRLLKTLPKNKLANSTISSQIWK